jgi:hypothetical protein
MQHPAKPLSDYLTPARISDTRPHTLPGPAFNTHRICFEIATYRVSLRIDSGCSIAMKRARVRTILIGSTSLREAIFPEER